MSEKNSEIKFTEDEMKSLADIQNKYQNNMMKLGQQRLQQYALEEEIQKMTKAEEELKQEYIDIQKSEEELMKNLNDTYGEGSLDPQTGIFTPSA